MILVKVVVEGEEIFYVVNNVMEVFKKMAFENTKVDSIETLSKAVIMGIGPNEDTPQKFLVRACNKLGVTLDVLRGTDRGKREVHARKIICYAMKRKFNITYIEIGDMVFREASCACRMAQEVKDDIEVRGPMSQKISSHFSEEAFSHF